MPAKNVTTYYSVTWYYTHSDGYKSSETVRYDTLREATETVKLRREFQPSPSEEWVDRPDLPLPPRYASSCVIRGHRTWEVSQEPSVYACPDHKS